MRRVLLFSALLLLSSPGLAFEPGEAVLVTDEGVAFRHGPASPAPMQAAWSEHAYGIVAPWGLVISSDQRVFVSTAAGRIYDVTSGGDQSDATSWVAGGGDLRGLWIDGTGRMLVADASAGIVVDATDGGPFDELPVIASGLGAPSALFETRDGRLLVSESATGEVTDISAGGDFSGASALVTGMGEVVAFAQDQLGRVHAAGSEGMRTLELERDRPLARRAAPDISAASRACLAALLTAIGLISLRRWIDPELPRAAGSRPELNVAHARR